MIEHEILVEDLVKPGIDVLTGLNPAKANLIHMVLGISGEAGELVDAIKKSAIYDKKLDLQNVIEELGDIEFYMEGLRQELGIAREDVLMANIKKLRKRYGETYSNEAAQARADKA